MKKLLSWEEIKNIFPDEWVTLVDYEDDVDGYIARGKVIHHNANKERYGEEFLKLTKQTNYHNFASLYTGELKPPRWRRFEFAENE